MPYSPSAWFALAAIVLPLVAACSEPAPYSLRRVSIDDGPGETIEAGGVTRRGLRMNEDRGSVSTVVEALNAGRITLFAAPSGDAVHGGGVDIEVREAGWRAWTGAAFRDRCRLRWGGPGTPVDAPWQACTFELPRPMDSAHLELRRRGTLAGEVLVSQARIEGRQRTQAPDVFILLLDAARFDGLRPFRADAGPGDRLEELARDSVVLRNLHAPSSWTRPAVATLFTGLRADRHRVLDRSDVLSGEALTLAEMLAARGYSTAAWSTNPNVLPVWGLAQGFDVFMDQGTEAWASGKTDGADVISRLRAALASRGPEPVFYYAHLMDPHSPYRPNDEQRAAAEALPGIKASFPRPLAIVSAQKDWKAFLDYTGELLDTDDHVGSFVAFLKDTGAYDDALILVVADHGEEFIDHGGRDHGRTLYEEVLHIPGLIKLPANRFGGTVVEDPVSLVDILPTLLPELGLDLPPGLDGTRFALDGRGDGPVHPHVAILGLDGRRQTAILDPPWKFIRNDVLKTRELYNLDEDPRERKNVILWQPDIARRLAGALDLIMSHGQEGWHLLFCGTLDAETMDVEVLPSSGTVTLFGFQEGEAQPSPEQKDLWRLRPNLAPASVERAVFGRMTEVVVADQAELLVSPTQAQEESMLEIRGVPGSTFDYFVGTSTVSGSASTLTLNSSSPEVVYRQGRRIACAPSAAGASPQPAVKRPFLRVWYVPRVQTVDPDTLDPGMQERLRALGYLQ